MFNAAVDVIDLNHSDIVVFHDVWEQCAGAISYRSCVDRAFAAHHLYGHDGFGSNKYCLGGVFCMQFEQYVTAGGFSNQFEGWGHEDRDFGERVSKAKLRVSANNLVRRDSGRPDKCIAGEVADNGQSTYQTSTSIQTPEERIGEDTTGGLSGGNYVVIGQNVISNTVIHLLIGLPSAENGEC